MGKCRTKLDGSRSSFLSQNSLRILIPETRVPQNVQFRYKPQQRNVSRTIIDEVTVPLSKEVVGLPVG
jgi:hypothetical protein